MGSNSVIFILPPTSSGVSLEEKNLLPNSFLQEYTPFERASSSRETNRKSRKLCPFENMEGKDGGVPYTLNAFEIY